MGVQLCLKVSKRQWKCYGNCVERNVWAPEQSIMTESESVVSRERADRKLLWEFARWGSPRVEKPVLYQFLWKKHEEARLSGYVSPRGVNHSNSTLSLSLSLSLSLTHTHTHTHTHTQHSTFVVIKKRVYIFIEKCCCHLSLEVNHMQTL